jgi:ribosome biogenesis protein Tsr3
MNRNTPRQHRADRADRADRRERHLQGDERSTCRFRSGKKPDVSRHVPRRSRVYRAIVLDDNAVDALTNADAVAVDRRGGAAWPS